MKNEKICWIYHHFTHVHKISQSCDVWFLRYRVRQTKKIFILGNFLSFYLPPPMIPKIKILKKMNKMPGVIVLLNIHVYHMIYGSWNITSDRQKFSTFWAIFLPFQPLTTRKIKILTLKKTPGGIIILHICTINGNHMMYSFWDVERKRKFLPEAIIIFQTYMTVIWCIVPQIWSATDRTFCHFGPFFALLPSNNTKSQNFEKTKKIASRYYHFTQV